MSIESRSRQFGKVFDHWQIKEFLGSGSGGKTAVFRLQRMDSSWGSCALKIVNLIEARGRIEDLTKAQLTDYQAAREECSRSAEREVRLMDELRGNTNIVDYLDHTFVDWSEENAFGRDLLIRMELLTDLRGELRQGKCFSELEILKIGRDICTALVRCHSKNILHRDVKPENIFRNKDGDYKLGDFGVSRVLDACPGAVASTGIGTYEYWPAEQMTGSYDKRVDIYSLGLVLYELSNRNRLPFAATTYATGKEVSLRLAGTALPKPMDASPMLAEIILKACAFKPEGRYQSAKAFLKALEQAAQKLEEASKLPELPELSDAIIPEQPAVNIEATPEVQSHQKGKPVKKARSSKSKKKNRSAYLQEQSHGKKGRMKEVLVFLMLLPIVVPLCVGAVFAGQSIWRINKYSTAMKLMENGEPEKAVAIYEFLGDYQDSMEQLEKARLAASYKAGNTLMENGEYEEAVAVFEALGNYQDSAQRLENARLAADYDLAKKHFEKGEYAQAIAGFKALGNYRDSAARMNVAQLAANYEEADTYFENGEFDKAITAFTALGAYKDSAQRVKSTQAAARYAEAESLAKSGKIAEAAMEFYAMGERERSFELWGEIAVRDTVCTESGYTLAVKTDGTVAAIVEGRNDGECHVGSWRDIVAISTGGNHTVGLKSDGTVVASFGTYAYENSSLNFWKDIVAVSAGAYCTVGLKADGTVVYDGLEYYRDFSTNSWRNIVAVSAGQYCTVGLRSNGTVVTTSKQYNVGGWRNITAISAGGNHIVGLKADGTVVAVGSNDYGQCNVAGWRDIVAVSAGRYFTVGLRSNGTVVATGDIGFYGLKIFKWKNVIAVNTGTYHAIGLKSNGAVLKPTYGEPTEFSALKQYDIMLPNSAKTQKKSGTASYSSVSFQTATIVDTSYVNVRSEPAAFSTATGILKQGSVVQVYETKTNLGVDWVRIENGWVCMDYVEMNSW